MQVIGTHKLRSTFEKIFFLSCKKNRKSPFFCSKGAYCFLFRHALIESELS